MTSGPADTTRLWLMVFLAAWAVAFVYAFAAFFGTAPTGDGFTRGLNRVVAYLGWQGVAGMLALAAFGVGRRWPRGAPVRRLSAVPLAIALVHVVAIAGIVLWAGYAG